MITLARRDVLAALVALGAVAPVPAHAAAPNPVWEGDPPPGASRIGQAWLAEHPGTSAAALGRRLMPSGWSPAALERLRLAVAADFRQGRVFRYRGWRLSDTEGALFALAALTP